MYRVIATNSEITKTSNGEVQVVTVRLVGLLPVGAFVPPNGSIVEIQKVEPKIAEKPSEDGK